MNLRTALTLALAGLGFACTMATNPICLVHCEATAGRPAAAAASAPAIGASR